MGRQSINVGTEPNDGSGDNLRDAGGKINDNFEELYGMLGGDSASSNVGFSENGLVFYGSLDDGNETILTTVEPTSDNTVTIPDETGTVILNTATQTLTNKTLSQPVLDTPLINDASDTYYYNLSVGTLTDNRSISLPVLNANDVFTFNSAPQTLSNKTMIDTILTCPRITDHTHDVNGAMMLNFVAVSNATNYFSFTNADSDVSPILSVTGDDDDIDFTINAEGQGSVIVSQFAYGTHELSGTNATTYGKSVYFLNKTSSFSVSVTDGKTIGEVRHFINKNVGEVTLSFDNKFGTDTVLLSNQGDTLSTVWSGSEWYEIASTSPIPADNIIYDNSTSGLTATDVQSAIDEIAP